MRKKLTTLKVDPAGISNMLVRRAAVNSSARSLSGFSKPPTAPPVAVGLLPVHRGSAGPPTTSVRTRLVTASGPKFVTTMVYFTRAPCSVNEPASVVFVTLSPVSGSRCSSTSPGEAVTSAAKMRSPDSDETAWSLGNDPAAPGFVSKASFVPAAVRSVDRHSLPAVASVATKAMSAALPPNVNKAGQMTQRPAQRP